MALGAATAFHALLANTMLQFLLGFTLDSVWWECFWLKTMTYQTWLKNLKKLQKTWMLRRNPLVAEADSSTAFWIN